MNNKIVYLILTAIVIVAAVLRLYQLGSVPPSPDWDEAALGYNAYSILQTGKDEYGKHLPVILRSFDDYKPALYAYLIIPLLLFFDLNTFVVRLPSAIFGIIAVIATFFLVRELFREKDSNLISLMSAALLAISPWHIQFSRIAFEAQVGLSLNILAMLFFVKGIKRPIFLTLATVFAGLSIYVYQSEKVYLPILFGIFTIIYWKQIWAIPKKWILIALFAGVVVVLPMVHSLVSDPNSLLRAKGVSVFSDTTQFLKRNAVKLSDDKVNSDYLGMLIDNRRPEYVKAIVAGYISHFSLNWLFVTSDIERHHAPGMGLLYLFELPFLLIGIYILVFGKYAIRTKLTIFAIFLVAPIPASITSGVPHAVRTINFLPTFQILTALGLLQSFYFLRGLNIKFGKRDLRKPVFSTLIGLFLLIATFNFVYYLNQYFVQQNYYYSQSWQYGYHEAIDFVKPIAHKYDKIVVTNERPLDQSYIFFLFYLKYNPELYQMSGGTVSGGFAEAHKGFDKYVFEPIKFGSHEGKVLYIGNPGDIPPSSVIKSINFLDGQEAIRIGDANER